MFDKAPANFSEKHRNQTARSGLPTSLRCEARGDHPLKISWRKSGTTVESPVTDYRYAVEEMNTTEGAKVSILKIVSATREDSGDYYCIASNAYGQAEMTIHLYIQGSNRHCICCIAYINGHNGL